MNLGIAGRLTRTFIQSPLTPLFLLASLIVGLIAVDGGGGDAAEGGRGERACGGMAWGVARAGSSPPYFWVLGRTRWVVAQVSQAVVSSRRRAGWAAA